MNVAFAAPILGQQFHQPDDPDWADQTLTVARLDRDRHGFPLVTFRFPDGREITAYAAQVRAAIMAGQLVAAPAEPPVVARAA